jgi:hypothetical protein
VYSYDRASLVYSFKYTNKTQRYTVFFIAVKAPQVSGGLSAHHQEFKNYIQHLVYVKLAAATASVGELSSPTLWTLDSNKEYCITLHLVLILRSSFAINPLNAELNPICHLLALLGGATIVVVSRLRVKEESVGPLRLVWGESPRKTGY